MGKVGKFIEDIAASKWYKSTFNTATDFLNYHVKEHGLGRTAGQYTDDALKFFNENKNKAQSVTLRDGSPGLKIEAGNKGGYYTPDGKVVTYWD